MSDLLDYNLDDIPELSLIAGGEEVRVRIVNAEKKISKNNNPMLSIQLEPCEYPDAPLIFHNIMLPFEGMEKRKYGNAMRNLKKFVVCFGLSMPLDVDDIKGQEGYAIVGEESDEEYGDKNTIRKFVGPA